jgi:hypothetical protein
MNFTPLEIRHGLLLSVDDSIYPVQLFGWQNDRLRLPAGATYYGMVTEGGTLLRDEVGQFELCQGMFFVIKDALSIQGGQGLIISRPNDDGFRQIGGPLEKTGRLRYIDGCSDTLLVCPPIVGKPCLNHLHIPPNTDQTQHTHPSDRIGVIMGGRGECRTPSGVYPLKPGMGWRIAAGCLHSFFTEAESLDVVAWHPDSDFGPQDDNHPMINRTIIPGSEKI